MPVRDESIAIYPIGQDGDDDHAAKALDVIEPAVRRGKDRENEVVFRRHGFQLHGFQLQ